MYIPKPIDLDGVELPPELLSLSEQVAENVHEVWAAGRIAEGWVYGETYSREQKTTPCLVPYDELPESEKDYDRRTAFGTLRLICKLGYTITKTEPDTPDTASGIKR